MSPRTLIKQLTAKCQEKKGEIQMTTYQGVLHVIMGYQDKIHKTIEFNSFAEACLAAGELKLLYVQETIYEIGINKITFSDGKRTVEYSTIVKMNDPTEKATRDWAKRDPNYSKMLHDVHNAWENLHNIHEKQTNYLYRTDTLE